MIWPRPLVTNLRKFSILNTKVCTYNGKQFSVDSPFHNQTVLNETDKIISFILIVSQQNSKHRRWLQVRLCNFQIIRIPYTKISINNRLLPIIRAYSIRTIQVSKKENLSKGPGDWFKRKVYLPIRMCSGVHVGHVTPWLVLSEDFG